jgi:ATP-dependent Clp protease protease subunit
MNQGEDFRKFALSNTSAKGSEIDSMGKFQEKMYGEKNSLTPYILEEREMRVTQMDIFSRLMRDRIIWLAGPVNDRMSTVAQAQLMFLDNVEKKDIILHIDSPGGSVKSGLSIVDVMDYIKSDIQTVNTGMCASMGSVLLGAGTKGKRSSLRFSQVMCHQVSHGTRGNIQDTRITHREGEKVNYILGKLLAQYSGKDFDEYMETVVRDKWYTSEEAKEFGLIDEVIESKGSSINELLDGFGDYYNEMNKF